MDNLTKILIIDDESDLCFLLSRFLKKYYKNVFYKHNLHDGMQLFKKEMPHWLVLDNNLPDGSGWDNANKFYNLNNEVNIIFITANPDSVTNYKTGKNYIFIKPLNYEQIINTIK